MFRFRLVILIFLFNFILYLLRNFRFIFKTCECVHVISSKLHKNSLLTQNTLFHVLSSNTQFEKKFSSLFADLCTFSLEVTLILTIFIILLLDSDNRCTIMGGNRPMTPRRVKRRNVNSKSSHPLTYQPRQDQQPPPYFRKSSAYGSTRSSGRSSTRRQRATTHNPISKYLEQQQQYSFQQRSEYILSNFSAEF